MRSHIRRIALVPLAMLGLATLACQSDVKPVGDVLAHDSTLALEVYGARPDTIVDVVDADIPLIVAPVAATAPLPVEASPATIPARVEPAPVRTAQARRTVESSPAKKSEPRRNATNASNTSRTVATTRRVAASASAEIVPSRAWLVLPAGTKLEFEADRQVCSNTGDGLVATLSEPVVRAGGTIVPAGASARGEVIPVSDGSDSGLATKIQWLTFGGRAYAVKTRVTDADTKRARARSTDGSRARCIPDGGRIAAELTQPLRVLLTS